MAADVDCSGLGKLAHPIQCAGQAASDVVSKAANDTVQQLMNNALETFGKVVGSLGTMWVNVPTPQLTRGDSSTTGYTPDSTVTSNVDTILGYIAWIGLVVAVLSVIGFGITLMRARADGNGLEAFGRLGLVFGAVFLVTGASSLIAWVLPAAAPDGSSTTVGFLQNSTWYFTLALAVGSVILGGIRILWTQRTQPVTELLRSLVTLIMVSTMSLTVIQLAVGASDAFSVGVINAATDCSVAADTGTSSCFGTNLAGLVGLSAQSPIGTLGILILALIAILMTFVQVALMVVRSAMLVLLAGVLPLTASFTNTPSGEQWFRRSLGWLIAFILYKPAAALIYAAAFKLVGTDIFSTDDGGIWSVMTGLALMIIALVALPALMRFIAPMVAPAGGGAAGAALAGGLGAAGGEIITGAIKHWSSKSSSNTSSSSSRSNNKTEAPTGSAQVGRGRPAPVTTGAGSGGSAATGAAARGATAGAGAGAGAGAAGAGAGAGATGAASAAGPAGIAVIGAQKVAQGAKKAADVTKSAAEDAAEGGPSGSR